eukprot:gene30174-35158_t
MVHVQIQIQIRAVAFGGGMTAALVDIFGSWTLRAPGSVFLSRLVRGYSKRYSLVPACSALQRGSGKFCNFGSLVQLSTNGEKLAERSASRYINVSSGGEDEVQLVMSLELCSCRPQQFSTNSDIQCPVHLEVTSIPTQFCPHLIRCLALSRTICHGTGDLLPCRANYF